MNWLNLLCPGQLLHSKTLQASALSASVIFTTGLSPTIANTPEIGLEIEGSRTLNQATIVDTNYVGECPGEGAGTVRARFFSGAIAPASGQRVVVRNMTRGTAGDPSPYTDRDYSQGRNSESTTIAFGTRHGIKTLNVLEGLNDFEYEIKQGDRIVDKGKFSAEFERTERTRERRATCSEDSYCARYSKDSNGDDKNCRRYVTRTTCSCPNGQVVQRYNSGGW